MPRQVMWQSYSLCKLKIGDILSVKDDKLTDK
jgi:hypothetical protein